MCWAPWISQVQRTGLSSFFLLELQCETIWPGLQKQSLSSMVDPSSLQIMHFVTYASLTQEMQEEMVAQETHE